MVRRVLQTLTSGGQTPHPILTIFYKLPEGTLANMLAENKDPALKTVGARQTDRYIHTDRHTDRKTDRQT